MQQNPQIKQTKHTPGPWIITKPKVFDAKQVEDRLIVRETSGDSEHIAEVFQYRNTQNHNADGVALANARLIAAAPELLEALKLLYKAWEALIPCLKNSVVQDYGLVLTTAPLAATTAIAKAEGK